MPKLQNQNIPLVDKINIAKGAARDKKFIDPNELSQQMTQYDKDYYQTAADRFKQQYPDLVAGRTALLQGAEAPLVGGGDPYAQNALAKAGLGDVNLGSDMEHLAINTGQPIADVKNRDRSYFANLLNGPLNNRFNLEKHQLGLSGVDLANVALTNANMARMQSEAKTQNLINQGLAGAQQQAQTTAGIAGSIGSLAHSFLSNPQFGIGGSAYGSAGGGTPFLSSNFYNNTFGNTSSSPNYNSDMGETVPLGSGGSSGGGGGW